jgi:Zn-dependent oligopeptidase
MKVHELKAEINKRLSEINNKIKRLKTHLENEGQNTKMEKLVAELESIRDDIIHQYNVINTLNTSTEQKMKGMEKKIFASIDSFNKAFNQAGGIFNSTRMKKRQHSTDFKNPGKTE